MKQLSKRQIAIAVADYLQKLGEYRLRPSNNDGICYLVGEKFGHCVMDFHKYFIKWPLNTVGFVGFPVPVTGYSNTEAFDRLPFWKGEYGKNRRALCLFMAKEIRKEIRNRNYSLGW